MNLNAYDVRAPVPETVCAMPESKVQAPAPASPQPSDVKVCGAPPLGRHVTVEPGVTVTFFGAMTNGPVAGTLTLSSAALMLCAGPLANRTMAPIAPKATVASKRETGKRLVSARRLEDRTPMGPP